MANRRKHPHVFAVCPRCNHKWSAPGGIRVGAVICPLCGSVLERIPSPNKGEKGTFYARVYPREHPEEAIREVKRLQKLIGLPHQRGMKDMKVADIKMTSGGGARRIGQAGPSGEPIDLVSPRWFRAYKKARNIGQRPKTLREVTAHEVAHQLVHTSSRLPRDLGHATPFTSVRRYVTRVAKNAGINKKLAKLGYARTPLAPVWTNPLPKIAREMSKVTVRPAIPLMKRIKQLPRKLQRSWRRFWFITPDERYALERRSQYDPENVRTLEKEMRQHNVPSKTRLQWHSRVFGGSGGLKSEDIYKISRKKEAKKGVYIFPYVKTAPPEVNRILEETYRRHRKDLSSRVNAGDLTEREAKQRAAIASWAAVKRAGYRKVKKPMDVWEKQQQYFLSEQAQSQALWKQARQRWLKHGRMPKALMVPIGGGRFVRMRTVFPASEPAARASSLSVRHKLLNNPQVQTEMADMIAGEIHKATHEPTPARRMIRFKKKPTGHLTSALLVGGGATVGGAHLAHKRRREQEQKQYARFANVREGFPIILSELGFSKYPRAAALAKKAMTAGMLASNEVRVRTPRAGSIRRLFGKWANQGTPALSLTPRFNASVKVSPRYTTDQQMQRLTKRVSGGEVEHERRLLQVGKGLMNPQTRREFEKVARSWYSPDELAKMSHQGESAVQYSVKGFTSWLGKHPNLLLSAAAGSVTAAHLRRMWREHQEKRMRERYSLRTIGHQALEGIRGGFRDSLPPPPTRPLAERMGRAIGAAPNEMLVGVKNTVAKIPGGIAKGAFLMGLGLALAKLLESGSKYWPGAPVVRADVEGLEPYYLRLARYYARRLCAEGSEQELHYAAIATTGFAVKARNAFLRHAVSFLAGMITAELLGRGIGRKKETHQLEHIRQPREYSAHYVMRARTVPRHGMHLIPPAQIAEGEARSILRGNKRQARSAKLRKAAKLGVPVVLLSGGVGYLGLRKKRDGESAKQYQVASWFGKTLSKAGKWLGIGATGAAKSPWGAGVIPKGMRGAKRTAYVERMFGVPRPSTTPWTQRAMKTMKENPMIPAFGIMTAAPLLIPPPEQRVRHIYDDDEER